MLTMRNPRDRLGTNTYPWQEMYTPAYNFRMERSVAKPRTGTTIRSPKVVERRARIRADLLEQGGRLFAARGVDQVSVEEILAEVGISRRTFYGFFANKYEMVASILNPALDDGAGLLDELAQQEAAAALPGIVHCYLSIWREHPNALPVIASLDAGILPYIEAGHRRFGAALKAALTKAEAAGLLRNKDAGRSFRVLSRTAVPLLKVYADHPEFEALYSDSMLALLGKPDEHEGAG